MKKFHSIMMYIFGIIAVVGFICLISVNDESEYWFWIATGSLLTFLVGVAGANIFSDVEDFKASCWGIGAVVYLWTIRTFRKRSKIYRMSVRKFGRRMNYKLLYHYAKNVYYEEAEKRES